MSPLNRRQFLHTSLAATGALLAGPSLSLAAPPAPGVWKRARAILSGEERTAQADIWCLEVFYKPLRMLVLDLPDPKTGKKTREKVWYLCYRAVHRVEDPAAVTPTKEPPLFVPEVLLKADRISPSGRKTVQWYYDSIMPAAQAALNKRERHAYKNSVQVVAELPRKVDESVKDPPSLWGCAMWRNVDDKADKFMVYFSGFSNGYQIGKTPEPESKEIVLRKTLVLEFDRPSDEFLQGEEEIKPSAEPRWEYLPPREKSY